MLYCCGAKLVRDDAVPVTFSCNTHLFLETVWERVTFLKAVTAVVQMKFTQAWHVMYPFILEEREEENTRRTLRHIRIAKLWILTAEPHRDLAVCFDIV